jgi:hypothetical protein
MKAIKKFFFIITHFRLVREVISFLEYGYFVETGWLRSYHNSPQDAEGNPLAWVTLPFIHFIDTRLDKNMTVFEFGSGNSTHYFGKRVKNVFSVEHDKEWFDKVNGSMLSNCKLYYKDLEKGYEKTANEMDGPFDIILVDGRMRVACIKNAYTSLNEQGVLVLDNSEREEYKEGIDFLLAKGFKKIDFWGIAPGLVNFGCTTVFYRKENCLMI